MKINVSTCYAIQMTLYLARNIRTVSSTELSEQLMISQRYIIQIAAKLRDNSIIKAHAGTGGGFSLAKESSTISVYDVIRIMEGGVCIPECVQHTPRCEMPCRSSNLLDTLTVMKEYLDTYLKTITFDMLADMGIKGQLSEIIWLVESHISTMKQIS